MSTNRGHGVLLAYNWDRENCLLYGVAGCPLLRGCLSIEVNGRTVGTFRNVRYIMDVRFSGVSVKRGSTVHRYNQLQNLRTCTLLSQERSLEASTKVQVHVTVYERYLKKKEKICSI